MLINVKVLPTGSPLKGAITRHVKYRNLIEHSFTEIISSFDKSDGVINNVAYMLTMFH